MFHLLPFNKIPRAIKFILMSGSLTIFPVSAANLSADQGRIDFLGQVTDTSCNISIQAKNHATEAVNDNVWLAPLSFSEIYASQPGALLKPQHFTLELSDCYLGHMNEAEGESGTNLINVRWIDGFMANNANNENFGYLKNTQSDGESHIFLALSTNGNNALDNKNIIIPADPLQNTVPMIRTSENSAIFNYYVGYVTTAPEKVTGRLLTSWATWEIIYN